MAEFAPLDFDTALDLCRLVHAARVLSDLDVSDLRYVRISARCDQHGEAVSVVDEYVAEHIVSEVRDHCPGMVIVRVFVPNPYSAG